MTTSKKFNYRCEPCKEPIWVRHHAQPVCRHNTALKKATLKNGLLRKWVDFLDELTKLPKDRHQFHISRLVRDDIIVSEMEKFFSEDELTQLTKFEKKSDVFKIGLGEWM